MNRRKFLRNAGLGAAALGVGAWSMSDASRQGDHSRPPNIIYILADDLGWGEPGCYGQKLIKTPNIDRMAAEGKRYTQHYAGSTVCAPSRCVLMTGKHTGHCFVRDNFNLARGAYRGEKHQEGNVPIPEDEVTVAEVLKKAGYTTGCIGKWGLGYPGSEGDPVNQGFDHFFGYNCQREAHSYYPGHLWRNREKVMLEGNKGGKKQQYSHDLMADDALDFIRRNKDNPFFLYVPFTIPHAKFQVPDLGRYADKPWKDIPKKHAAMVTRMDRDIGRMLDLLKELGLDENTLVMFSSDNGPHGGGNTLQRFDTNGPFRGRKRDLYEGGIRVPLVARWPGKITPGTVSEHVSCFQDMMPTWAELAGTGRPSDTDGISMAASLLDSGKQVEHEYLYWERGGHQKAVRMGKWKGVCNRMNRNADAPIELYDLEKDPGEQNDIAENHPQIIARIGKIMQSARVPVPDYAPNRWKFK